MPCASSRANSSSSPSVVESSLRPEPGANCGGASTRVFVRGRPNVPVVAAEGGGGGGDDSGEAGVCEEVDGLACAGLNCDRTSRDNIVLDFI